MCRDKNLTAEEERIAEAIFSGLPVCEIASQFGVTKRTAYHWGAGSRRSHIATRANELMEVFAKQCERRLMRIKSKALDVIEAALNAVKVESIELAEGQHQVPDHKVRLQAASNFKSQFGGALGDGEGGRLARGRVSQDYRARGRSTSWDQRSQARTV